MGNYTNAEDIRRLYKEIDTVEMVDNDIDFYIKLSEGLVDGMIAGKYTVPVSPAPIQLRDCAAELTVVRILERFSSYKTDGKDRITQRRDNVIDKLKAIANGDILLTPEEGGTIAQDVGGISSTTERYSPTFGVGNAINEEVDPCRIQDEEDARD